MVKKQETRYNVDIDDIRAQDANLAKYIIDNPSKCIRFLEQHLRSTIDELTGVNETMKSKSLSLTLSQK